MHHMLRQRHHDSSSMYHQPVTHEPDMDERRRSMLQDLKAGMLV